MTAHARRSHGPRRVAGPPHGLLWVLLFGLSAAGPLYSDPQVPVVSTAAGPVVTVSNDAEDRRAERGEIYVQPLPPHRSTVQAQSGIRERVLRLWQERKSSLAETEGAETGPSSLAPVLEELRRHGYGSMAGMRAGATDELTVPCDMDILQRKVAEACVRSRMRSAVSNTRSLLKVFEQTMSAAAFAEAGEFETAEQIMGCTGSEHEESKSRNDLNTNPTSQSKHER